MKNLIKTLLIALVSCVAAQAQTIYTSKPAFLTDLSAGFYFTNFAGLGEGAGPLTVQSFSGGTPSVSYDIQANPGGLFVNFSPDLAIGNYVQADDVAFTFTSGNVHTVGAEFFLTDINGVRQDGSITVNFSDGSSAVVPSASSGAYGFLGLSSPSILTSLTVDSSLQGFINVANFYASPVVVPEPGTVALLLVGGAGVLALGFRKRA